MQAAANFINNGRYQEAINVLNGIDNKTAQWYYYSAMAHMGLGNNVAALEHANKAVALDPQNMEYQMLLLMASHAGHIFSAQNLYESVWNEPYLYSSNGTVMVHIRKLRVKLEDDPQNPKLIQNVWGKGYRFG